MIHHYSFCQFYSSALLLLFPSPGISGSALEAPICIGLSLSNGATYPLVGTELAWFMPIIPFLLEAVTVWRITYTQYIEHSSAFQGLLPSGSPAPQPLTPSFFPLGYSCHSLFMKSEFLFLCPFLKIQLMSHLLQNKGLRQHSWPCCPLLSRTEAS